MKEARSKLGLVLVLLLIASCAGFSQSAYKGLVLSYHTYDGVLSSMGSLYKEGKVSEEQKAEAIKLGRVYAKAHNEAVGALATYEEAGGEANKDAYKVAAVAMGDALSALIAYARPIIERSE